ncbi:MAG: hypothetical protein K2G97_00180, partial [Oscillospiraceae bacterium]|nr:hypothetical protein [Oscillospiraceae bacterium]
MKIRRILSVILTVSIIATSFSSIVQASAQTEEEASNQAAQVAVVEDESVQTAAIPAEPTEEFIISSKCDFTLFMTTSEFWESNYKVTLACNIDMGEKVFNPIKEFDGVFDGCGHTISNLKIQNYLGKGKNVELSFINTLNENAEIKDVKFDNYTIEGNSNIKKAAGLVVSNKGKISGVDIKSGSINNINDKTEIAGFVVANSGKITNSNTAMTLDKGSIVGGFVSENGAFGIIKECGAKEKISGRICAGGFCGINIGEIISCKAESNVKAHTSSKKEATISGGFIGTNNGMIKNCSATGEVEGQEFSGGFAGINGEKGKISLCKSIGCVKSKTYFSFINCGGFIGLNAGKIENCELKSKVENIEFLCSDAAKNTFLFGGLAFYCISILVYLLVINMAFENKEIDIFGVGFIGCFMIIVSIGIAQAIISIEVPKAIYSGNDAYLGGFCGYNSGEISKCSFVDVSISNTNCSRDSILGGFVGENGKDGIIKDCNITGNKISDDDDCYIKSSG